MTALSRSQRIMRYSSAARLVAEAIGHAQAKGWAIVVTVMDPAWQVLASGPMDRVHAEILSIANDKAYTATLGVTSLAFGERMASAKSLGLGLATRDRLLAWEGRVPIGEAGALIVSARWATATKAEGRGKQLNNSLVKKVKWTTNEWPEGHSSDLRSRRGQQAAEGR